MRSISNLYTLGYEGLSLEAFIDRLMQAGVQAVIDVRELPLSRKKGFSKRSFAEALRAAGLGYVHVPALGCPKPIRNQYKQDANWTAYERKFNAYLGGQGDVVLELARTAQATPVCLVCYEADFNYCHRSLVARAAMQAGGLRVVHLTSKTEIPEAPVRAAA